jgi:hypothetical protein
MFLSKRASTQTLTSLGLERIRLAPLTIRCQQCGAQWQPSRLGVRKGAPWWLCDNGCNRDNFEQPRVDCHLFQSLEAVMIGNVQLPVHFVTNTCFDPNDLVTLHMYLHRLLRTLVRYECGVMCDQRLHHRGSTMDKWRYRYFITRDLMLLSLALEALTLYPSNLLVFLVAAPVAMGSLAHRLEHSSQPGIVRQYGAVVAQLLLDLKVNWEGWGAEPVGY